MPETAKDVVDRELREFKRYTGDGLPGEPINAPLPVGDPNSGVHNPKKVNLRNAMLAPLEETFAARDEALAVAPSTWQDLRDEAVSAATDAENQADRAEDEADRAEAAGDAAQLAAGVYADTSAGISATSNGDYFSVPASDVLGYLSLYRNVTGSAVFIKSYPSVTAIDRFVINTAIVDDPETLAILDQLSTPLTKRQQLAIQTARKRMEIAGLWSGNRIAGFGWAGYSAELAAVNWRAPDGTKAVMNGSTTHLAGTGYIGGGSGGSVALGFAPSSVDGWALDAAHLGVFIEEMGGGSGENIFFNANTGTNQRATLTGKDPSGNMVGTVNGSIDQVSVTSPDAAGHYVINRQNSSTLRALYNGSIIYTNNSATAGAIPTTNLSLMQNSTAKLSAWHLGRTIVNGSVVTFVEAIRDIILGLRDEVIDPNLVGGLSDSIDEINVRLAALEEDETETFAGGQHYELHNRFDIDTSLSGSDLERFFSDDTGTTRRYRRNTATATSVAMEETFIDPSAPSKIVVIQGGGQSLENGGDGGSALTTTPTHPYLNFKLNGNWPGMAGAVTPGNYTYIEPLVLPVDDNERPVVARLAYVQFLASLNRQKRHTFLAINHALGASTIAQLSKGTTPYDNGLALLERGEELTTGLWDRDVVCPAVFWTHGERDRTEETSFASYVSALDELIDDYNADYQAATGQSDDVVLWMSQLSAPQTGTASVIGPGEIALAQLDVSRNNALARMTGPRYHLPFQNDGGNNPHLTNVGYRRLGEMDGKAFYREFIAGEAWEPLWPVDAALSGSTVTITFNRSGIEFDTESMPFRENYGFEYGEDDGSSGITISNVAITGDDEITITLSGSPDLGDEPFIRYAYTALPEIKGHAGAWGNVKFKDNAAPSFFFPGETVDDWLVTFKEMLA